MGNRGGPQSKMVASGRARRRRSRAWQVEGHTGRRVKYSLATGKQEHSCMLSERRQGCCWLGAPPTAPPPAAASAGAVPAARASSSCRLHRNWWPSAPGRGPFMGLVCVKCTMRGLAPPTATRRGGQGRSALQGQAQDIATAAREPHGCRHASTGKRCKCGHARRGRHASMSLHAAAARRARTCEVAIQALLRLAVPLQRQRGPRVAVVPAAQRVDEDGRAGNEQQQSSAGPHRSLVRGAGSATACPPHRCCLLPANRDEADAIPQELGQTRPGRTPARAAPGGSPAEEVLLCGAVHKAQLGVALQQGQHVGLHRGAGAQQEHAAVDALHHGAEPGETRRAGDRG